MTVACARANPGGLRCVAFLELGSSWQATESSVSAKAIKAGLIHWWTRNNVSDSLWLEHLSRPFRNGQIHNCVKGSIKSLILRNNPSHRDLYQALNLARRLAAQGKAGRQFRTTPQLQHYQPRIVRNSCYLFASQPPCCHHYLPDPSTWLLRAGRGRACLAMIQWPNLTSELDPIPDQCSFVVMCRRISITESRPSLAALAFRAVIEVDYRPANSTPEARVHGHYDFQAEC
jgi:hypothetical protein